MLRNSCFASSVGLGGWVRKFGIQAGIALMLFSGLFLFAPPSYAAERTDAQAPHGTPLADVLRPDGTLDPACFSRDGGLVESPFC